MIKIIAIIFTIISLNSYSIDDFDLYKYGPTDKLDISRIGFVFKIVFYDTHEELQKAFRALPGDKDGEVRGFTMVSEFNDVCVTHIVKPKIWDDREAMAIMGHEVYHCTLADHKAADPSPRVVSNDKEKTDEELYDEDRQLELEGLKEECENTKFEIVGCAELKET